MNEYPSCRDKDIPSSAPKMWTKSLMMNGAPLNCYDGPFLSHGENEWVLDEGMNGHDREGYTEIQIIISLNLPPPLSSPIPPTSHLVPLSLFPLPAISFMELVVNA